MRTLATFGAVILAATGASCSRSVLSQSFAGGMTQEEALRHMSCGSAPAHVRTEQLSEGHLVTVAYGERCSSFGHTGAMQLQFFDGSLERVAFYPDQPDAYLAAVRQQSGADLRAFASPEAETPPLSVAGARVWATEDYRGKRYVGWADPTIEKARRRAES